MGTGRLRLISSLQIEPVGWFVLLIIEGDMHKLTSSHDRRACLRAAIESMESRLLLTASFTGAATFDVGANPSDVAVADVDGDGHADLLVANQNASSLSLLYGTGDGGFAGRIDIATAANPVALAVGDVNADGHPDAVVALAGGQFQLLKNNGAGGFVAQTAFGSLGTINDLSIADMDGDGKLDLVASGPLDSSNGYYAISLGNGRGSFSSSDSVTTGRNSFGNVVADFNADGIPDVAVANQAADSITVVRRPLAGDATRADYDVQDFPYSVATGDFNGDGKLDIVVGSTHAPSVGSVSLLLNQGNGTFADANDFDADLLTQTVRTGDFDGDGNLDVAAFNALASNVSILSGDGAGQLGTATNFEVGLQPQGAAVADLNNDGKLDIVSANFLGNSVSVLLNNGTFDSTPATTAPDLVPGRITSTLPDVVVAGDVGVASVVLTNSGDALARGHVTVKFYGSTDGFLDTADALLDTGRSLDNRLISVAAGRTVTLRARFAIPQTLATGTYYLLAKVESSDIAESSTANNLAVSSRTVDLVRDFGSVDTRSNVRFSLTDSDGSLVTFILTGGGTGHVTDSGGVVNLTLDNTTARSNLSIVARGGEDRLTTVGNITINGPINVISASTVNLTGNLTINGDARTILLRDITGPSAITIGGTTPVVLRAANVANATINSTAPIRSLLVTSWVDNDATADVITAPYITALVSRGEFAAGLSLSGVGAAGDITLRSAVITGDLSATDWSITGNATSIVTRGSIGADWTARISGSLRVLNVLGSFAGDVVANSINTLAVRGDVSAASVVTLDTLNVISLRGNVDHSTFQTGVYVGADGSLGGGDDGFEGGVIRVISVTGNVTASTFAAGVDLANGVYGTGGRISAIAVRGEADADSRFVAEILPRAVRIGNALVLPASDPRFTAL
jgi:hypothetical protein